MSDQLDSESKNEEVYKEENISSIKSNDLTASQNISEDEGEIEENDQEAENLKSKESVKEEKSRKRPRHESKEQLINKEKEPASKLTALERLKNMTFSKKDPFGNISAREHRTLRFTRTEKSPLKKTEHEDDRIKTSYTLKHPSEPNIAVVDSNRSMVRQSNYTNEKPINVTRSFVQPGTLKQRVDSILSIPEKQIMCLTYEESFTLIMQLIELEREQQHLLNGRCQQIIELDLILNKEREEIEKLKKEIPEQFHPPTNMYEAMFPPEKRPSNVAFQNAIYQQLPAVSYNEFGRITNANPHSNNSLYPVPVQMGINQNLMTSTSELNTIYENQAINLTSSKLVFSENSSTSNNMAPTLPNSSFRTFQTIRDNIETPQNSSSTMMANAIFRQQSSMLNEMQKQESTSSQIVVPQISSSVPPPNFSVPPPVYKGQTSISSSNVSNDINSTKVLPIQMTSLNIPPPSVPSNMHMQTNTSMPPPVVAPNLTVPPPISNSSIQSCIVPNMSIPPPKLPNNSTIASMEFGINNVPSNVSAPISNIVMNIQNLNIPITSAHLMRQNEPSEIQNSGNSNWKRIQTGSEHKEDSWNIREKECIKNDIMNTDNEQTEFREETQIEKILDEKHNSEMNSNALNLLNNNKELTDPSTMINEPIQQHSNAQY